MKKFIKPDCPGCEKALCHECDSEFAGKLGDALMNYGKKPYTVALMRPRCIKNEDLKDQDGMLPYLANQIMARNVEEAVALARDELYSADFESDGWAVDSPEDFEREEYLVLYVFDGHTTPASHGYNFNKVVRRDD